MIVIQLYLIVRMKQLLNIVNIDFFFIKKNSCYH